MALTVGELTGLITIDGSGIAPGLRTAERQMQQSGQQMGDDAQQAGQQAGQALGDGVVRGSDGRLRDLRGRFVRAGRDAGDGLADGVRQGSSDVDDAAGDAGDSGGESFIQRMRGSASEGVGEIATNIREGLASKLALASVGAAAGALLMSAMADAMDQSRITGRLGAQLGKTPAEAQRYGHIAGRLYANAVTEDFQGAADAISAVMRAGIAPPEATNAQIQSIATKVSDLANTFELDLGQTANAVGQMIKTGLVDNGAQAVDIMAAALPGLGQRADDVADTFNEYSTIFRQMGISGADAMGLMSQGLKAGARDTDVVADSLKEFVLLTQSGGTEVDAAFKKIGLSGKEMQAAFIKGGPEAKAALDKVFDGLRNMKDGTDKNNVALTLFGTKSEDTQKALMALDPSKAADSLGKLGGAADRMGDSLRDNAGTRVEQFKRGIQQGIVDFLGGQVLPAIDAFKAPFGRAFGGIWSEAGKAADGGNFVDRVVAVFGILGKRIVAAAPGLAKQAVSAISGFGSAMADYIISNPMQVLKIVAIAGAIILAIAYLPALISGAISATAILIVVGFVSKLVSALQTNLPKWWAAFTGWVSAKAAEAGNLFNLIGAAISVWFGGLWSRYISGPVSSAWSSFISSVQALPGRTIAVLAGLGALLAASASRAFTSFRNAAAVKVTSFLSWTAGIPGRISRSIGSLSTLLTQKGKNVVQGLWNGIQGMGGWLKSKIMGWAKSVIPGPVAKALGISSPSKVMARQVGRWIPAGIVAGINSGTPALDRTMANLVNTPTPSAAAMAMTASSGAATASGAAGEGGRSVIELRSDGSSAADLVLSLLRDAVHPYGGNIEFAVTGRR
ncbi:phage tail tape measure protein [Streptomyces sp. NPDC002952]|uniref:phage tail tape measure protein n=1 Tax=Streptomyces sp. NPDC002952 TaxID=3364673 RepID=UPI00368947F4